MKTDNIYIAELGYSTKTEFKGNLEDYYFGPGIQMGVHYKLLKYIIVKKQVNFLGEHIAIDLKTKKQYLCKLPLEEGVLFVPKDKMLPFEVFYPDSKRNLQKKKILKMGNNAIDEIIKIRNEKTNRRSKI